MGQPNPDHGTEKTPPPSGAPSSAGASPRNRHRRACDMRTACVCPKSAECSNYTISVAAGRNSAFSIAPAIVVLLAAVAATFYLRSAQKPFELKPSNLPKVTESTLFNASYREDMYWGTYRPGFYAGTRQHRRECSLDLHQQPRWTDLEKQRTTARTIHRMLALACVNHV